jgi:hypothetical protein
LQSVPAPHLISAPRVRVRRLLALLVAVGAVCAAGLALAERTAPPRSGRPALALVGGLPLQQARCEQWLGATSSERDRALSALHGVVGGPTPFGQATALTPAEAERLFDRTCAMPIARNFLLYELYTRASGFRSLAGQ